MNSFIRKKTKSCYLSFYGLQTQIQFDKIQAYNIRCHEINARTHHVNCLVNCKCISSTIIKDMLFEYGTYFVFIRCSCKCEQGGGGKFQLKKINIMTLFQRTYNSYCNDVV